jgi:pimeloyl-ACP methyl ester carboxylesterase
MHHPRLTAALAFGLLAAMLSTTLAVGAAPPYPLRPTAPPPHDPSTTPAPPDFPSRPTFSPGNGLGAQPAPPHATITLVTSDDVRIAANHYPATTLDAPRPLLILLHGSNRTKERWEASGFTAALAEDDYHMLALDIRGRGASGAGDPEALRRDPTLAWADLDAAIAWAATRSDIDQERIALVGSSYGANLAASGLMTHDWPVRTIVGFSATRMALRFTDKLGGPKRKIPSGLFLACDAEMWRYEAAATAEKLLAHTDEPREAKILMGSYHAISLFERFPDVPGLVRTWLRENLAAVAPPDRPAEETVPAG